MIKMIEYSTYSYTKNIQNFTSNFQLIKNQFTETIYRKDYNLIICREYEDQISILKEDLIDKYKNRKYLCKSVETHNLDNKKDFMNNFSYFAVNFDYKEVQRKPQESYFFEGDDFCLEISSDENNEIYLIKLSSNSEEVLDREVASMEYLCEFKKPVINF